MARTRLEREIIAKRKQDEKGHILVPMLHALLNSGLVGIDTPEDAAFLYELNMQGIERERLRREGYENNEMVFSPSSLAKCLRKVYLSKKHQDMGLVRAEEFGLNAQSYFFTGDWIHLKWQFAFYKLNQLFGKDFILIDVEVGVMSKHGDHGGTVDAIAVIYGEPVVIDVKGLNVRGFQRVSSGDVQDEYRIQVADYIMLLNSQRDGWPVDENWLEIMGWDSWPKIKRGIILAESKGGPDTSHPAGLTEHIVSADENMPEVRFRLAELRKHEQADTVPAPECESTRTIQFQGCPFRDFCKKEVSAIERAKAASKNTAEFRLASPQRRNRSRRTRSK